MRIKGTVKWFNSKKGFGFITRADNNEDVFVHWTDIKTEGFKTLNEGDEVEFSIKEDKKGPKAVEVVNLSPSPKKKWEGREGSGGKFKPKRKFQ